MPRLLALALVALSAASSADAQTGKVYRVGVLVTSWASLNQPSAQALKQGLRDLGYAEGRDVVIEYQWREFAQDGGLMSYGANVVDLNRRAASYIDKILKGARPADIPVELPTKYELVVNLKTAKALGLTVSPSILLQADTVIE